MQQLPLQALIGAPLRACIIGMTQASAETIKFMKETCFKKPDNPEQIFGDPIMVNFSIGRNSSSIAQKQSTREIEVPFLTMVNLPYLRLAKVSIHLSIKLSSVQTLNLGSTISSSAIVSETNSFDYKDEGGYGKEEEKESNEKDSSKESSLWFEGSSNKDTTGFEYSHTTSLIGTNSSRYESSVGATVSQEYSLEIHVQAVQDDLPRGIEKILDILENETNDGGGGSELDTKIINSAMQGFQAAPMEGPSNMPSGGAA